MRWETDIGAIFVPRGPLRAPRTRVDYIATLDGFPYIWSPGRDGSAILVTSTKGSTSSPRRPAPPSRGSSPRSSHYTPPVRPGVTAVPPPPGKWRMDRTILDRRGEPYVRDLRQEQGVASSGREALPHREATGRATPSKKAHQGHQDGGTPNFGSRRGKDGESVRSGGRLRGVCPDDTAIRTGSLRSHGAHCDGRWVSSSREPDR